MKVDMEEPRSVVEFAKAVIAQVPIIDYLILNAGIAALTFITSPSGHESSMQTNYLSNTLLLSSLLPHLEASAEKTGRPCRISWVGSRRHMSPSFGKKPLGRNENVLEYMDNPKNFSFTTKYDDSKALCAMFMYQLAPKLNTDKVVLNMICPATVKTAMGSDMPLPIRIYIGITRAIKGRSVEEGTWVILYAALVADASSHGQFLTDMDITP
jgi:NAD(P)-dependent dehydrogenase (short-subunit alcohol dehydrogenase family)